MDTFLRPAADLKRTGCRFLFLILAGMLFLAPVTGRCQSPVIPGLATTNIGAPAVDALPQLQGEIFDQTGISDLVVNTGQNKMTIRQNQEKAIMKWKSFDIGAQAWVHFDQQGHQDWAVLNRIHDISPSRIFGRLTGDGRIYLINQNGILFGKDSRVNVHSLVASSLDNHIGEANLNALTNIHNQTFSARNINGRQDNLEFLLIDRGEGEDPLALPGAVRNYGTIETDEFGFVYLIAPVVENQGTLSSPGGFICLAAGNELKVSLNDSGEYYDVSLEFPEDLGEPFKRRCGLLANHLQGRILADIGHVAMAGREIHQDGLIRSVSAVKENGRVMLLARDRISTGAGSQIICPISGSAEKVHESFDFKGPTVVLSGLTDNFLGAAENAAVARIEHRGRISASAGKVFLKADERVYLASGSQIDVSGNWIDMPAEAELVTARLGSMELKNDYGQKEGGLKGQDIQFAANIGTAIGEISALLGAEERTARERSTRGGDITITALSGDVIVRDGAHIGFAGGGYHYAEGVLETSKLVCGNRVFDISEAPQWLRYDKLLGLYAKIHERYGIKEEYTGLYLGGANPLREFIAAHDEGHDAGSLTINARGVLLDGVLDGSVVRGEFQTDYTVPEARYGVFGYQTARGRRQPRGGELTIGDETPSQTRAGIVQSTYKDYNLEEVVVTAEPSPLPADFDPQTDELGAVEINGAKPFVSPLVAGMDEKHSLFRSRLSAETLNAAGLSDLKIYTNTTLTLEKEANLKLYAGGFRLDENQEYMPGAPVQYHAGDAGHFPATFSVTARGVNQMGAISSPSASVCFQIGNTITSSEDPGNSVDIVPAEVVDIQDRFYLAEGGLIDLAGERIDNTLAGEYEPIKTGHLQGGRLKVSAVTFKGADIVLRRGSEIDVSGGYLMDPHSGLTAGDAGSIEFQGAALALDGALKGHSLPFHEGGRISLHANKLRISQAASPDLPPDFTYASPLPPSSQGGQEAFPPFVFGQHRFDDSGFTEITLKSYESLAMEAGVRLGPSLVKLKPPAPQTDQDAVCPVKDYVDLGQSVDQAGLDEELMRLAPDFMGTTAITLISGPNVTGEQKDLADKTNRDVQPGDHQVSVSTDSTLWVAPGGSIALEGAGIDVEGMLSAPAGSVDLDAKFLKVDLGQHSKILAAGYNRPENEAAFEGYPVNYRFLDGGSVSIASTGGKHPLDPDNADRRGCILMQAGSEIDISGSEPVSNYLPGTGMTLETYAAAGDAGRLLLTYNHDLALSGTIDARARLAGVNGGTFVETKTGEGGLLLGQSRITSLLASGFDAATFRALQGITFSESVDAGLDRFLMLDAPKISAAEGAGPLDIRLSAPWLKLVNSPEKYSGESYHTVVKEADSLTVPADVVRLCMAAEWLDVEGSLALDRFSDVTLQAERDIRLEDAEYDTDADEVAWLGRLRTPGNLTLEASRIYPVTNTDFTLRVDQGALTIRRPANPADSGPILSAGGRLALEADVIDHQGYLAAPLGEIAFGRQIGRETGENGQDSLVIGASADRVLLGAESVTTTKGQGNVLYGMLKSGVWKLNPKPRQLDDVPGEFSDYPEVDGEPQSAIDIQGVAVDIRQGAVLDVSGGGLIFAAEFLPSAAGLTNPLEASGRYVIVPGIELPGESVFVEAAEGLPAGTYSLLPAEYAFLSGAYVLEDRGAVEFMDAGPGFSTEGYPVARGYFSGWPGNLRYGAPREFALRPAAGVLAEGHFNIAEGVAGVPGRISVKGESVSLQGSILMEALPHFKGGEIEIASARVAVGKSSEDDFEPDIVIDPEFLAGIDAETIRIGDTRLDDPLKTREIRIYSKGLKASRIKLAADGDIILKPGGRIDAVETDTGLEGLLCQYVLEPQTGIGILRPVAVDSRNDAGAWGAVLGRKRADGEILHEFRVTDGKLRWSKDSSAPGLSGLNVALAQGGGEAVFTAGGRITLMPESRVHVSHAVRIEDGQIDPQGGVLEAEGERSTLALKGENIYFIPATYGGGRQNGLFITEAIWESINNFSDIYLISQRPAGENLLDGEYGEMVFMGDFTLTAPGNLILDAVRIAGIETGESQQVKVGGANLWLKDRPSAQWQPEITSVDEWPGTITLDGDAYALNPAGNIAFTAEQDIWIGHGDLLMDGFRGIDLSAAGRIVFQGEGSLIADQGPEGHLNLNAGVITTAFYQNDTVAYEATNFIVDAGQGRILTSGGGGRDTLRAPGGQLTLKGRSIEHGGTIDLLAGRLDLIADGSDPADGICLTKGSEILVRGGAREYLIAGEKLWDVHAGGSVALSSEQDVITVQRGARIDVSNETAPALLEVLAPADVLKLLASGALDAGEVSVNAAVGGADIKGTLTAQVPDVRLDGWQEALMAMDDDLQRREGETADAHLLRLRSRLADLIGPRLTALEEAGPDLTAHGMGGGFALDTRCLGSSNDLSGLMDQLGPGRFDHFIDIRLREGSVKLHQKIAAHGFKLTADGGGIDFSGEIDASNAAEGGLVALYAWDNLNVTGKIKAGSDYGDGGRVVLGAGHPEFDEGQGVFTYDGGAGELDFDGGSIDVAGGGKGGRVHFRAYRGGDTPAWENANMDLARGTIHGADAITAETVLARKLGGDANLGGQAGYDLGGAPAAVNPNPAWTGFKSVAGVEIQGENDLTLNQEWNLEAYRQGGNAGILTLRAGGDLKIGRNLLDTPTLDKTGSSTSWTLNLVAGADLASADSMAVRALAPDTDPGGEGVRLTFGAGARVYTEFGDLNFASAGNTYLEKPGLAASDFLLNDDDSRMVQPFFYNLATYSGTIRGAIGGDLHFPKNEVGGIQSAAGDVDLEIGGGIQNFYFTKGSGIRTTGKVPFVIKITDYGFFQTTTYYPNFSRAAGGGDIRVAVQGDIGYQGNFGINRSAAGDQPYDLTYWSRSYLPWEIDGEGEAVEGDAPEFGAYYDSGNAAAGIVTMGGGGISVSAGGDIDFRIGAFREGDVRVDAGGDISGHFLLGDGWGTIKAMGNFDGKRTSGEYQGSISLLDATIEIAAQGSVAFGSAYNPTLASFGSAAHKWRLEDNWYLTYDLSGAESSALSIRSITGDTVITGSFFDTSGMGTSFESDRYLLFPPDLQIVAGGDIRLENSIYTAPSNQGGIRLISGGNIDGQYKGDDGLQRGHLYISDLNPAHVLGRKGKNDQQGGPVSMADIKQSANLSQSHFQAAASPRKGDRDPVEILAAGDILEFMLTSPKAATILSGGDIKGLYYMGQNIRETDQSRIRARGDILMDTDTAAPETGFWQAGPGGLLVQAGNSMQLGLTYGIQMVGNSYNPDLSEDGGYLAVVSGMDKDLEAKGIRDFFGELKPEAKAYSHFIAEGKTAAAADLVAAARERIIDPLCDGGGSGEGNIHMTDSQISALAESTDIFIVAAGELNVGLTTFADPTTQSQQRKKTGIFTAQGGGVNIYTRGDVNVNESRIMTFLGQKEPDSSDIVIWSDYGDINAGRGSRTAINVSPPETKINYKQKPDGTYELDDNGNPIVASVEIVFTPPAVGSGIRAMTYDPDGSDGPLDAEADFPIGDIYLTAPEGIIDAGEAGIAGGNLYLGATEVLNAQNIEAVGLSVGFSTAPAGSAALGSLAGTGSLAQMGGLAEETAALASEKGGAAQEAQKMADGFKTRWLDVQVIEFE